MNKLSLLHAEAAGNLIGLRNILQAGPNDPLIQNIVLNMLTKYANEHEAKVETLHILEQLDIVLHEPLSAR